MTSWRKPKKTTLYKPQKQEKTLISEEIKAFGGDKRDRTADLLNAIQALSQLSYTPIFGSLSDSFCIIAQMADLSRGFD